MRALAVALLAAGACRADAPPPAPVPAPAPVRSARVATVPPAPTRRTNAAAIERDLRDADPKIRRATLRELVAAGEVDVPTLTDAARDPDIDVAVLALDALGKRHAAGEVPAALLVERAADRVRDPRTRAAALNAFGTVASTEAADALVAMLRSGDLVERRSAAILLAHQALEVAIPALIDALADADEGVRANALEVLRQRSRGRDFATDAAAWRAWWQSQR